MVVMKFRKGIFKRRFVEADEGGIRGCAFSVELRLRGLAYREGDHILKVGVEPLRGAAGWAIYLDTFSRWEAPFGEEKLSSDEITRVRENIVRALDAMQIAYSASGLSGTISD